MDAFTTTEAGDMLGLHPATVLRLAKKAGLGLRPGPNQPLYLTRQDIEAIRVMNHRPGRPRKETNDAERTGD